MADKKISQLTASTTPLAGTEELAVVQSGDTKKVSVANLTVGRAVSMGNLEVSESVKPVVRLSGNGNNASGTEYGAIEFFNNDPSGAGPNITASIKVLSTSSTGAGGFLAFATSTGGEGEGSEATEKVRIEPLGNLTVSNGNLVIGTSGKGIDFSADGQAAGMTSELLDDYEEGIWTPELYFGGASGVDAYSRQTGTYKKIGAQVFLECRIRIGTKSAATGSATIVGAPFVSPEYSGYWNHKWNTASAGNIPGITASLYAYSSGNNVVNLMQGNGDVNADTALTNANFNDNDTIHVWTVIEV